MRTNKFEYEVMLADMRSFFGRSMVEATEAARYLGIDPRTARKWYNIPQGGIPLPILATRIVNRANKNAAG